jgi:hypothetical protein
MSKREIIVKVEDTLGLQLGSLDKYRFFSLIEKVKIIVIYILRTNENFSPSQLMHNYIPSPGHQKGWAKNIVFILVNI